MSETTPSHVPHKSSGYRLATASLILAIASLPLTILCLTGVLTAIAAIPLGHIALRRARTSPEPLLIRNRAAAGLVISYLYIGFVVVLCGSIVANRISKTKFSDDTGMNFIIHTPLKGTSYEWQVKHRAPFILVMAPEKVQISTQLDVVIPIAPHNPNDFQYLSINLIPKKYDGNIADIAHKLASGTRAFNKNYNTTEPELLNISGIPSALFRESLVIDGSNANGIVFLVPCTHGYYLLTFRCDPNSYDESFFKRIASTFKPLDS